MKMKPNLIILCDFNAWVWIKRLNKLKNAHEKASRQAWYSELPWNNYLFIYITE